MPLDRFRIHRLLPDYVYFSLVLGLCLFGLIMISSSSAVLSVETYSLSYAITVKQAVTLVFGLMAMSVISRLDYHKWRPYAAWMFALSLVLLLAVFIPGLGKTANGAARWIDLGAFQIQPSEILKLTGVIYFAAWLEAKGSGVKSFRHGLLPLLLLLLPIVVLMMWQRDLGTLLVMVVTAIAMIFVAGGTISHIIASCGAGLSLITGLILIEPYRLNRLTTYLNPTADKLGLGYHINQSLIAIGSGGLLGRGFGRSLQKYLYLPEPHTDSIFAIIVEELGFFRTLIVLAVVALLIWRGYRIAFQAGDDFGRMMAFGITTWFACQFAINISAILGLVPLTGVTLPFVSYGGTSLIMSLCAAGVVLSVSRYGFGKA